MAYKSSPVGNEISCVFYGLNPELLNNYKKLENILVKALKKDKFTILKKVSYVFNPQGFTLVILLAESHTSIHTYPEYNSLCFYLYSCRGKEDGIKTFKEIKKALRPKQINFNQRSVIVSLEN